MTDQEVQETAAKLIANSHDLNGCRIWSDNGGHLAFISFQGSNQRLHRVAYQVFVGPIPEGDYVINTCCDLSTCRAFMDCPHRGCINPEHLMLARAATPRTPPPAKIGPDYCLEGHRIFSQTGICTRCVREIKRERAAAR